MLNSKKLSIYVLRGDDPEAFNWHYSIIAHCYLQYYNTLDEHNFLPAFLARNLPVILCLLATIPLILFPYSAEFQAKSPETAIAAIMIKNISTWNGN